MGIYVFNREVCSAARQQAHRLRQAHHPGMPSANHRVFSYVFQGYWEDIGTIRSFFEANLDLVSELPRFNFFDMAAPIFTRPRFLPGLKINGATIDHAVVSDGCIITRATIRHSWSASAAIVGKAADLNRVVADGR
jgi:glucose-1-phosphate adenylyltransferase